ncbi:MAG: CIA30 family protein [Gammaproteobacteria bacterium]|nr:CIA30 family protein [Gammaproteobacteria bacterium]
MNRKPGVIPFYALIGLLLMTFPGPTLTASDAGPGERVLTDFTATSCDLGWYVLNDDVMGGRSTGDFDQERGELRFTGRTNTNGGGFSSIRTQPMQLDLSTYTGIQLRTMGDGRRYTWLLTTTARWRGRPVSYRAEFDTRNGTWSTVNIPFSSFAPRYRGLQLDGPALEPAQITGMGLMIYDHQDGAFELRLASVKAYAAEAPFTLSQYEWKKRVLVLSAPTEDDKNLRQQQNELALTAAEFADRDMALVTLLADAVSTAEDRELTKEEATTARAALGIEPESFALRLIGKDGSIKLSGATATPVTEIYALIDTMPMRQRETRGR